MSESSIDRKIPQNSYAFLGGTAGTRNYRPDFIGLCGVVDPKLPARLCDPIIYDRPWVASDEVWERTAMAAASLRFYYFNNPNGEPNAVSQQSFIEASDDTNARPRSTAAFFDPNATYQSHTEEQFLALQQRMRDNGVTLVHSFVEAAHWLAGGLLGDRSIKQETASETDKTAVTFYEWLQAARWSTSWRIKSLGSRQVVETYVPRRGVNLTEPVAHRALQMLPKSYISSLRKNTQDGDYLAVRVGKKKYNPVV